VKSTLLGDADHIEVRGLRRVYGTGKGAFEAVRGIDLVVGAGTIVALLGTNGAGRTSALEVVEGLAVSSGASTLLARCTDWSWHSLPQPWPFRSRSSSGRSVRSIRCCMP